jgi:hypothetical protein
MSRNPAIAKFGEYESSNALNDERNSMMTNVIGIEEFKEAKKEFMDFANESNSSRFFWN